jgi:hypothetical protein
VPVRPAPGFLEWCRWRLGLRATRPAKGVPPARDFYRQWPWALEELARFNAWNAWRSAGSYPRPRVWARVPDWAWALRAEWLRAAPKPAPAVRSFWDRPGMLLAWGLDAGDPRVEPDVLCAHLAARGFKWVAPEADETSLHHRDALRAACDRWGLDLAIWMQNALSSDGRPSAEVFNRLVREWEPDAAMICLEGPAFESNEFLADAYRLRARSSATLPRSVITNLDFQRSGGLPVPDAARPWVEADWHVHVEAYLGSNAAARPVEMEFAASQVGWRHERVHPLIELSETARAGLYVEELARYGGSWAAYLMEQAQDADLVALEPLTK